MRKRTMIKRIQKDIQEIKKQNHHFDFSSKSFKILLILVLFPAFLFSQSVGDKNLPQLGKQSLKDVISSLTLEEKANIVVGMGFKMPGAPRRDSAVKTKPVEVDHEKVPGAAGRTHAVPRLGIPSITVSDGPAGVRIDPFRNGDSSKSYYASAFPVATLLASSWDTALVRNVGIAFGNEAREYGVDILLAPGLNIHRNPLGGRNFEYYSEDPFVAGTITAAIVNGIQSNGVGVSIKHFAANNQETNRNSVNTIVSERALREIYLKGFEIAVKKSNPWTVMTSYNKINGAYTSEQPELIAGILRKEWGFNGLVMSDWFGGHDAIAQMKAGNDLLMPGTPNQSKAIVDAVNKGELDIKTLDENVERILKIILISPEFKKYKYAAKPDLVKHAQVARMAAAEGMILLKNDNKSLPLKNVKKIAVFGNTSYDIIAGGTGSGNVNRAYTISLTQGLINAGYQVDDNLKNSYLQYIADAKSKAPKQRSFFALPPPIPELTLPADLLTQQADNSDAAIITIGRNAGEGADRKLENDYYLSAAEKELIKNVGDALHAKNKKLIVVLNIGGVMEVASWRDMTDAILLAWQPGLEAGNAIADILSGKINPSGKLATTFPVDYNDVPSAKNFPGKELAHDTTQNTRSPFGGTPSEVVYEEGVYVGYRYYNTFKVKTAYPFGYGLSYTNFSYGKLTLSTHSLNGKISASITVTNNGSVAGKEVVQLYISAPGKIMDKPAEELRAFAKTKLLQPGQSQTLSFAFNAEDISSYDNNSSSWIAEPGMYTVKVGASSTDIKQTATFQLAKSIVTEKDTKLLAPQVEINELKGKTTATSSIIYELNDFALIGR